MKTLKNIVFLFAAGCIISSCEDVIELDLDQVAPKLVVEANMSDQPGPYFIELSETANFYDDNNFNPKAGAEVIIYDEIGNRETLRETTPGIYQTSTTQGVRGVKYTLEIMSEGKTYTATNRIPDQGNPIDSLVVKYEEESIFRDEGYYVTVTTQDPAGVDNYYRLKIFVNGLAYIFNQDSEDSYEDNNIYLSSDKFTDGQYLEFGLSPMLKPGDKVKVELYHISKATYDYYRTLLDAIGTGGLAPANPISNFGEQALGNFNTYVVFSDSTEVK